MVFELFSDKMKELIEKKGFVKPTEAQKMGIPDIMKGRNVLVMAPTGTGKTEIAMLPLMDKIHQEGAKPISAIYITPLRSLNRDMLNRLVWWATELDIDVAVRHGDTTAHERALQREMPSHVMITTPESLQAMLVGKKMKEHLKNVRHVVVDECHELVGSKRGIQLSVGLERLRKLCGGFRTIGLSATVGSPERVAKFLKVEKTINAVNTRKSADIKIEIIPDEPEKRMEALKSSIETGRSTLVFTNTRQTAESLSSRLKTAGLNIEAHHGSLSKDMRIDAEEKFRDGKLRSLVCTSSLELGMDIGAIDFVIQYMSPRQVSRLVQRVGRAGHSIRDKSKGLIFTSGSDVFESVVITDMLYKGKLEEIKIHELALDVLCHQIAGMTVDEYEISSDEIYETVMKAYPYRNLKKDDFTTLLRFMGSLKLLWLEPIYRGEDIVSYKARRSLKGMRYYFENLSTIPSMTKFRVVNMIDKSNVGTLDEEFVADHGERGNTFICGGSPWKIVQVVSDEKIPKILVEPSRDIESSIPSWDGEQIPIPKDVSSNTGALMKDACEGKAGRSFVSKNALSLMEELMSVQKESFVPDGKTIFMESKKDFIILHSFNGTLINNALARYIASRIGKETGISVRIKPNAYRIIFQTLCRPSMIKKILETAEDIETEIYLAMESASLFRWKFLHNARRFGIINPKARLGSVNFSRVIGIYRDSPVYRETMREIFTEKLDIKGARKVADEIRSGSIALIETKGLSRLGEEALMQQFSEIMKPSKPDAEMFKLFKKRITETKVRMACIHCFRYTAIKLVDEIEEKPRCPKCGSGLIGVLHTLEDTEIIAKKAKGNELTADEEKRLDGIRKSADMAIDNGRLYFMIQAGRGIGPATASRILRKWPKDELQLLKYMFEAEKTFARTKVYWD